MNTANNTTLPPDINVIHGKELTPVEVERLNAFNQEYTHTVLSGKHCIARQRYNAAYQQMVTVFEPISEFSLYFLNAPKIAGMNAGKAWLCWPGKNFMPGGVTFQPNVDKCPSDSFNLWQGWDKPACHGDVSLYLDHINKVICDNNPEVSDYLLQWMAHMIQKPDEKPSVAVLMKSVEGTGKGTIVRPLEKILGPHFIRLNGANQLTGRFNSIVANRLMVFADEVDLSQPCKAEKLKALISEPTVSIEMKGVDPLPVPNFARFVFCTNNSHALMAGQRERRYLVIEPNDCYVQDQEYFNVLYHWLNIGGDRHLLHYLMNLDIKDFNPNKAPVTKGLIAEKLQSMNPVQQWCYAWLEGHSLPTGQPFPARPNGTELAKQYREWLADNLAQRITPRASETSVGYLMKDMRIKKGRTKNGPRFYELAELDSMRERFAQTLGHSASDVFTEL